ncbi:MAG: inorganic phosphate transporter [Actinobacteria bacterium RBG_19FT_COMBO_70_19]|jgi:PiT family inorganic phosphate transporter|nr:MAG: inorganic phosphate transporter [Actinobacteria bacterium RBG_19FT_COMBO_70_19]
MPLWLVLILAYVFEFANGWTDAPNSIATVVSTRVLRPHHAVLMAGALNLVGALAGTAVAKTIAADILDPNYVTLTTIGAAVLAASIWALGAQFFGLPSSESHALIAGLLGAGFAAGGLPALESKGTGKALIGLVTSPLGGFLIGLFLMVLIYRLFARVRRSTVSRFFGKAQILSAAFMAFSHGTNDAQKTMGIITLAVLLNDAGTGSKVPESFDIPLWVIFSAAFVIGVGTMVGGWRVVRTLGLRLTKLEPVHGFAAETGAALVITGAAQFGIPVSTTHAIGSAIMGVGATKRFSAVRWGVAGQVVTAWVLTWPSCMVLGYVLDKGLSAVF